MKFPVKNVVLPADLRNEQNGALSRSLLRDIEPKGQLHHIAADAWRALRVAAYFDKIPLTHEGAYRPMERQMALWLDRYSTTKSKRVPEVTRTLNGVTYYLKVGKSPSAVPGTSPHGLGISIDCALRIKGENVTISADPDGKGPLRSGTEWLLAHAVDYGWCWQIEDPSDPNFEAWHLDFYSAKLTPAAVRLLEFVDRKR